MSNKEYSTPVIVVTSLNKKDIITASMGTESSIYDIKIGDWEW